MADILIDQAKLEQLKLHLAAHKESLASFGANYGDMEALVTEMALGHAGAPVGPTVYAQRDQRWTAEKLGFSTSLTLGGYGCLVSSMASILTDAAADAQWTPAALNSWLRLNNGFSDSTNFIFAAVDKLGIVKFETLADYQNPAPVAQLDEYVKNGGYVLVKVDFDPRTIAVEQHYCRYLGDGKVMDPWHGDIASLVGRYRGKTTAEIIWRAAYYQRAK
jgi:hypothetical protein